MSDLPTAIYPHTTVEQFRCETCDTPVKPGEPAVTVTREEAWGHRQTLCQRCGKDIE